MCEQQNARMSRHAAVNDGQADWLDVQTLYASGRFADQPRSSPSVVRECLRVLFISSAYSAFCVFFCFVFVLAKLGQSLWGFDTVGLATRKAHSCTSHL